jgi:hypothetical protein
LIRAEFIITWTFLDLFMHLDGIMRCSLLLPLYYLDFDFMM